MEQQDMRDDARFVGFIRSVHDIVSDGGTEQEITKRVAVELRALLADGLVVPPTHCAPREDRYVMYPLYVAPDGSFSIASAVWNVGQATPVHDHGVWGVVGIAAGVEREIRYVKPAGAGGAGPLEKLPNEDFAPGDVTICCTSDADIHAVSCASDRPCVGIHVYGGDIGQVRRRTYDPATGEIGYFTSAWPDVAPAVTGVA